MGNEINEVRCASSTVHGTGVYGYLCIFIGLVSKFNNLSCSNKNTGKYISPVHRGMTDQQCRLVDSLSIILEKDLCNKSSFVNIYVYDCHINHIYVSTY